MDTPAQVLDTKGVFSYGTASVKKDFWYFIGIAFVVLVLSSVGSTKNETSSLDAIGLLLSTWMTAGSTALFLRYIDGPKPAFSVLFSKLDQFLPVLGATLLVGLITAVTMLLLIIPGIYFALKYQFVIQLIIDRKLGVIEAMKESGRLTQGKKMSLLLFDLQCIGIMLLGFLALGVGILVAVPVVQLAATKVYRSLVPVKTA